MLALAIILPVVVLIVKLVLNLKAWHSRRPVKHTIEWLIMVAACAPSILIFAKNSTLELWYGVPLAGAMIAFFIWLFFDGLYNKLRGFAWFFTGSDDADDAVTDNFLQRLPLALHVIIKIGGLAALVLTYLKFFLWPNLN